MPFLALQITIFPQPLEEAVLADFDAVLVEQLGHFAYQDGCSVFVNRLGEVDARLITLKISVFALDEGVFFFNGLLMLAHQFQRFDVLSPFFLQLGGELFKGGGVGLHSVQRLVCHVSAGPADGRDDVAAKPMLEAFGFRQLAAENEGVNPHFVDDDCTTYTFGSVDLRC